MICCPWRICILIGLFCARMSTVTAQDLGIPTGWKNTTFALSRESCIDLASNASTTLVQRVALDGSSDFLPSLKEITSALAALALQDLYTGKTSWNGTINNNVQSVLSKWGLYGGDMEDFNSDSIYWGLAFFYAYKAYNDKHFLDLAVMAYNATYTGGFITPDAAVNGTGAGRNVTFTRCSDESIAGGVFYSLSAKEETSINSETVSPFMALSAYLFEATGNTTYKDAARLSLQFIKNQLWNGTIVYDTIRLSDCVIDTGTILTYNQAWLIEGLSVYANVTKDLQMNDFLREVIPKVTQVHDWSLQGTGVITENAATDDYGAILKGIFVRGLIEARMRNPADAVLSQYIEAYLAVQFNALQYHARTPTTHFYTTSWIGPVDSNFTALGNIAALDVLNAAVLFSTPTSPSTGGSATSTGGPTASSNHFNTARRSSHVGSIAGGVVAGVVVAVAAAVICIIRYRRRKHVAALNAVPERSDDDKPDNEDFAPAIEPFVHPDPAPLARSKWQRMNAPSRPAHGGSLTSAPDRAPSIDLVESVPMLTSGVDDSHDPRARPDLRLEITEATAQPRAESGRYRRSAILRSAVPDTATFAPPGDNAEGMGREQPLTLADLPILARHLYPLLQDQQAEHPPEYGP
ncbi:hypothetical protein PENSPDRAFT_747118 [Peniophora sp. CONT]|nr:hypothetical protein PENSPDRAFT_747118 [Peniophora sp. CONT]